MVPAFKMQISLSSDVKRKLLLIKVGGGEKVKTQLIYLRISASQLASISLAFDLYRGRRNQVFKVSLQYLRPCLRH